MMRTPFLVLASAAASRMLRVLSVSGVCRVMKSARRKSSSSSTFSTPSSMARSGDRKGSNAITFIFRPMARSATIEPMLPQPITPSVLAYSSTPRNLDFSHLPAWVERSASGIWRASAIISEMACSAVVMELPKGVFITMMPLAVAALHVDVVDADAGAADHLQVGRGGDDLLGGLGGGAHGEAVVVLDDLLQLFLDEPTFTSVAMPRSLKMATAAGES